MLTVVRATSGTYLYVYPQNIHIYLVLNLVLNMEKSRISDRQTHKTGH